LEPTELSLILGEFGADRGEQVEPGRSHAHAAGLHFRDMAVVVDMHVGDRADRGGRQHWRDLFDHADRCVGQGGPIATERLAGCDGQQVGAESLGFNRT
jgi:hypothetical protein